MEGNTRGNIVHRAEKKADNTAEEETKKENRKKKKRRGGELIVFFFQCTMYPSPSLWTQGPAHMSAHQCAYVSAIT